MTRVHAAFGLGLGVIASACPAQAAEPHGVALGGDLGYAFPGGSLESGSKLSDVSFGVVRLGVDAAYRLHSLFSAGLAVHYGFVIPTLCNSGGDCTSSLGSDVALALLGRWHIGTWRSFAPTADLELGYEWFSAKHSDGGVVSTRSYRGLQAAVRGDGQFRLSRVFSLGPFVDFSFGSFNKARLEAPGVDQPRSVSEAAVHLWVALGVRAVASW